MHKVIWGGLFLLVWISSFSAFAGQRTFPVFDGQFYNGLFYPRIDIVEWGAENKTHIEFHIYSKNDPIDWTRPG
jgi:hypothetical protein